jgi:thermostable 8-oxoguanine DNA glycosylase
MINPYEITNYNRTDDELQEFLLFAIIVAGKTAYIQANKLEQFLTKVRNDFNLNCSSPFELLKFLHSENCLESYIVSCKLGQYRKTINAFNYLIENKLDLHCCSTDDLELIPGVGPKTSRFFILHSRKQKVAVLDVHLLKWISALGYDKVPKTTPSNPNVYKKWEQIYLQFCNEHDKDPAELDLEIWKSYAKRANNHEN